MNLGSLLRKHRKEKKMTLRAVAERAGVSEGFMSQVENNVKSPSVDSLMKIGEAIEINIGDLLNQLQNRETRFVIRKSEWDDVDLPHTGFATRRFCPPEDRTVLDSAILFLEPGKSLPVRKDVKNGQEILGIMKGRLELSQSGALVELKEGDATHFWSEPDRQVITNVGDELAVVLWIGTL